MVQKLEKAREEMGYSGCLQKSSVESRIKQVSSGSGRVCASTNDEKMEKEKRPIDNRLVLNVERARSSEGGDCRHH